MPPVTATLKNEFKLDKFQEEAIEKIRAGKSVIVCAPTGAGKTVIAEQAIADALAKGKKVFYTTPLKALSNQKFQEFSDRFGAENVGILTGDTAKNREAKVVVMTTEIYRNMLYGTSFGSVDPYLNELLYVILDECHYMNDEFRGTVWEESIIYAPKSVQVVGLSATVNNPEDLISWISDIHGECDLVKTDFRPVPLNHLFFKDDQLMPLLTTTGKLNPQLKERKDNRFGKRKGGFNRFNSGEKAATADQVVQELYKKDLLPAIYFVFSRRGCDEGATSCENLKLLSKDEQVKLNHLIEDGIKGNPRLENHPQLALLRKGIATHHAGLLPNWKILVEKLFNEGLVKVVFSTETLAAGINMPARTTVISSISKRSDSGHRVLKPSEFLQMSGRAGRRGMDEKGFVVTIKNNYQTASEIAFLACAKAEDLESSFKSSYEMVLNLLQNHSLEQAQELIYRSFGQAQVNKDLNPLKDKKKKLEDKIMDLQHPLCPGEIGDLKYYNDLQERIDKTRRQKKDLENKMAPGVEEKEQTLQMLTLEAQGFPCNGCPKQKPCSQQMSQTKRFKKQVREINEQLGFAKDTYWKEFQKIVDLLKDKAYVDADNKPTETGKLCASLRSENSLLVSEVLRADIFGKLSYSEFAAAISSLVTSESRGRDKIYAHPSPNLYDAIEDIRVVARNVLQSQRKFKTDKPVHINGDMAPLVEAWTKGEDWDQVSSLSNLDDGDIIRGLRRTLDLVKQIYHAPNLSPAVQKLAQETIPLMEREPVLETA